MTDTATTTDTQDGAAAPTSTDAAENPAAGMETPGDAENGSQPENDDAGEGEPKGRAAQYRKRAQDAEARAAQLEEQITGHAATIERLQRLHVDRAITETGLKPAAVYAIAGLADLLGDDGLPDPAKITAAVTAARDQLGAAPKAAAVQRQRGLVSGASGYPAGPKPNGWAGAFAPRDN